jgi:hypothetical protein
MKIRHNPGKENSNSMGQIHEWWYYNLTLLQDGERRERVCYVNVHPNMGMAKAFGLFPTIYQEYSKKQVDSKYLFSIDIMVSYINNKCTYSTNLIDLWLHNFHG